MDINALMGELERPTPEFDGTALCTVLKERLECYSQIQEMIAIPNIQNQDFFDFDFWLSEDFHVTVIFERFAKDFEDCLFSVGLHRQNFKTFSGLDLTEALDLAERYASGLRD